MSNTFSLFTAIFCSLTAFTASGVDFKPIIREEITISIDGVEELWRLEWLKPPAPVCDPEDDDWMICPCNGFAFGEIGDLDLVRIVPGKREDRFSLTQLFEHSENFSFTEIGRNQAVLMKFAPEAGDSESYKLPGFKAKVAARSLVEIMRFGDYDHDGRATEFLLQIDTLPCGKKMCLVVGISTNNDRLHAFTSVKNPHEPLILQSWQWKALRNATGSIKLVNWQCGDHGYNGEDEYELRAERGNIYALLRRFESDENCHKVRLLEEREF